MLKNGDFICFYKTLVRSLYEGVHLSGSLAVYWSVGIILANTTKPEYQNCKKKNRPASRNMPRRGGQGASKKRNTSK